MVAWKSEQADWSAWFGPKGRIGVSSPRMRRAPKKRRGSPGQGDLQGCWFQGCQGKEAQERQGRGNAEAGREKQVVPPKRRIRGKSADLGDLNAKDEGAGDDPPAENATFARRYRPTRANCLQKWLALRQAYNTRMKPFLTYHSRQAWKFLRDEIGALQA